MTKRLTLLFPLILILTTVVASLILYFIEVDMAKRGAIDRSQADFKIEMSQLQNILNAFLSGKNFEDARLSLSVAALHPNLTSIVVFDENATVILASHYHLTGAVAKDVPGFISSTAAKVINKGQPQLELQDEGKVWTAYYPLTHKIGAPEEGALQGILYAEYDLRQELDEIVGDARNQAAILVSFLLLVTILFSLLLHFRIGLRVQKIVTATQRFAEGHFSERLNWKSEDELGAIAQAFDKLAEQRESAEVLVRNSLESLNQAQEISHVGSWSLDLITNQIAWSDEVFRIFGFSPQEFSPTYETFLKSVYTEDRQKVIDAVNLSLIKGIPYSILHRVLRPNGELIYVEEQGRIFYDDSGKPLRMVGTVHNVTERHKIELELQEHQANLEKLVETRTKELLHSSRLAALGEMAGGIAHEINNPLAIIEGKSSLALELIEGGVYNQDRMAEDLKTIASTSQRIARIVHGLRVFSRSGESEPLVEVPLREVVDDTLSLCQERFRVRGIELFVKLNYQDKISCRPTQLSQVLLNLLNNSYDAVCKDPAPWIEVAAEKQGNMVAIKVVDSGLGINPAVAEKIMQPFFTTKEIGQGTGLGLSISRGIIEDHGGRLWLDQKSQNTCFVIELPFRVSEQKRRML